MKAFLAIPRSASYTQRCEPQSVRSPRIPITSTACIGPSRNQALKGPQPTPQPSTLSRKRGNAVEGLHSVCWTGYSRHVLSRLITNQVWGAGTHSAGKTLDRDACLCIPSPIFQSEQWGVIFSGYEPQHVIILIFNIFIVPQGDRIDKCS